MKFSCLVAACVAWGCSANADHAPSVQARFSVHAASTDGSGLSGVILETDERRASTGADGTAELTLAGRDGERREIRVLCPENYQSPPDPLLAAIRRPSNSQEFRYDVLCTPLRHTVVVVARAINGSNLPILRLGREIGRTSEDGIAHALLSVQVGESLRLTLDTEQAAELLPRSPTFDFPGVERDEIVTINQVFERPPPPPKVRRFRPRKKHDSRPTRL